MKHTGPFEIHYYSTVNGKEPAREWLHSLDKEARRIVTARLLRVQNGNFGDYKKLKNTKGVCELRFDIGPGYRLYFLISGKRIILLLCGGNKKTQKKDVAMANSMATEERG